MVGRATDAHDDGNVSGATGGATPLELHKETNRACPECSGPVTFDAHLVGDTAGGLARRGWDWCAACERYWLSPAGCEAERWRVAGSGLSVDAGRVRIRLEGGSEEDRRALAARIARLPELERHEAQTRPAAPTGR